MSGFVPLGVDKNLVKGLKELKIVNPTEIQERVIPHLLNLGGDLIGQAQTGTGKTAAYGLPLLQRIDPENKKVQALVLAPTRELAMQIQKQLFRFTKHYHRIFAEAVYGGTQIDDQIDALRRPTQIIVATPGRLIDLQKRKAVDLSSVRTVVMDEADEMLRLGWKKDLEKILGTVSHRDTWLFSATMPEGIKALISSYMSPDVHKISVSQKDVVNKNIEHQFVLVDDREKFYALQHFLKTQRKSRGVIFCKTKAACTQLAEQLQDKGIKADAIQGDMKQLERDKVMRAFKNESLQILVATDLAARGIDVDNLAYVVHYQMPDQIEYYTHRSGRTARAGNRGLSLCLVNHKELKQLRFIERNLRLAFRQIR